MFRSRTARTLLTTILSCFLWNGCAEDSPELRALAHRFRPYYKFSTENGNADKARPAAWEWFAARSELRLGSQVYKTRADLAGDPRLIILQEDSDLRTASVREHRFVLQPDGDAYAGQSWPEIIGDGAGLYAQVETLPDDLILLVYWTLYPYNLGSAGSASQHLGDITAVSLVYDRRQDALIRVSFVIHGGAVELFDLQNPERRSSAKLKGVRANGQPEVVEAERLTVGDYRRYQDGPSWHSPSDPDLYFVRDPRSGRFEHIALFIEWGAHEVWPNASGSVIAAPKHGGDWVSFLPDRVRYLGSLSAPDRVEEPFLFFNGVWGDPPSPPFHRTAYDHRSANVSTLKIPDSRVVDRDPYWGGGLSWIPLRFTGPVHAKVNVSVVGDRPEAQATIRWGHPDFHQNEYFPLWTVGLGQTAEREFALPDASSELEVQTEGGNGTGYTVQVWIDRGGGQPPQPSIVLRHNMGGVADEHVVNNTVRATRSSPLNQFGEQNIRVDTRVADSGPIK